MKMPFLSKKKIENTREACIFLLYQLQLQGEHFSLSEEIEKLRLQFTFQASAQTLAFFYGTLTHWTAVDYFIEQNTSKSLEKIDPFLLASLRLATWQLAFGKQRKEATVDEVVKIVKKYMHTGAVAFANAVLRNMLLRGFDLPNKRLDLRYGLPSALLGYVKKNFPKESLVAYLEKMQEESPLFVNFCGLEKERPFFEESLLQEGVFFQRIKNMDLYQNTPFEILEDAYILQLNGKALRYLESFQKGLFYVQGLASMLVSSFFNVKEDASFLDLCAAPGGKSFQVLKKYLRTLEKTQSLTRNMPPLSVYISDFSSLRLEKVKENQERLSFLKDKAFSSFYRMETLCLDAQKLPSQEEKANELLGKMDFVFCDVPCSCLGLLRSKPEVRLHMTYEKIQALLLLQENILQTASHYLKLGGRLIYSTCTFNEQENEAQIQKFLKSERGKIFQRVDLSTLLPHLPWPTYALKLGFPFYESEGFFLAVLEKISEDCAIMEERKGAKP